MRSRQGAFLLASPGGSWLAWLDTSRVRRGPDRWRASSPTGGLPRTGPSTNAGVEVAVEGRGLGTIPFKTELPRGRALTTELRAPAAPPGERGPGTGPESVSGMLVLPRGSREAVFRLTGEQFRKALDSGEAVYGSDTGPYGYTRYFKGSSAGVGPGDHEVRATLPTPGSRFAETSGKLGEGFTRAGQAVLIAALVVLLLWGASRTCVGQEATDGD